MTTTPKALAAALRSGVQCDQDGVMTQVSRRAAEEAAAILDHLASAGGVDVVAWIRPSWYEECEPVITQDSNCAAAWRDLHDEVDGLVRQSAHLAALSKEREVAQALRDTLRTFIEETMCEDWSDESDEAVHQRALEWCTRWHAMKSDLAREREVADGLRAQFDEARRLQKSALDAIRSVMEDAYHRRTAMCCGQAQGECCGNFMETWTADDLSIMDKLSPIEKALSNALTAHRGSRSEG